MQANTDIHSLIHETFLLCTFLFSFAMLNQVCPQYRRFFFSLITETESVHHKVISKAIFSGIYKNFSCMSLGPFLGGTEKKIRETVQFIQHLNSNQKIAEL